VVFEDMTAATAKAKTRRTRSDKKTTAFACGYCEKDFSLKSSVARFRLKQTMLKSGGNKLFCSRSCSMMVRRGRGLGGARKFARRDGWSDERWYWERKLVELGLGMDRGVDKWILYSLDDPRPSQ
jgi:hypothetical protein